MAMVHLLELKFPGVQKWFSAGEIDFDEFLAMMAKKLKETDLGKPTKWENKIVSFFFCKF